MTYQIDVKKIEEYIRYLTQFRKKLENDLAIFERDLKNAHDHWDDSNYERTVEAKNKIAAEQKRLIESTTKAIKNLTAMREQYMKYLRRR